MSTATAIAKPKTKAHSQPTHYVSKEEFLRKYSDREDGYKYEWNNGAVEKTSAMNQIQATLFAAFLPLFFKTKTYQEGGIFSPETDMDTSPFQLRRPDLAIYTAEQVKLMKKGENQVAPWVAEVISKTDKAENINEKLKEYFEAGVQVVWHIFPASQQVYVYTSIDNVTVCRGKTVCSGAPALPDFEITAEDLFA